MYQKLPNLVIGFHGCKKDVFKKVICGKESLKSSENDYDWLGHGVYFWEQNYQRALDWATFRYKEDAAVIGAVIDLGYCLNLTDSASAQKLKAAYEILKMRCEATGEPIPKNQKSQKTKDVLLRNLDCAVIQQIHAFNKDHKYPEFDSVRGIFLEGEPTYPGSEFREKTHVQICICNPNCIKGYFAPIAANPTFSIP